MECVWSIYNAAKKPLNVFFVDIDVEKYGNGIHSCSSFDYVEVVEVNATGTPSRLAF